MRYPSISMIATLLLLGSQYANAQTAPIAIAAPETRVQFLHHASTVGESHLRGRADLVRSVGQANYNNSLAAINFQEAYRRQLDNQVQRVDTYYSKKKIRNDYVKSYRRYTTMEQARRLAAMQAPQPLGPQHGSVVTGKLHWPLALLRPEYDAQRRRVEILFAEQIDPAKGPGSYEFEEFRGAIHDIRKQLGLQVRYDAIPVKAFVSAKNFLDTLESGVRTEQGLEIAMR